MSARWSDRQQAMLREMGVTLWLPPQTDAMPLPEAAMPEPVPSEVTAPVPAQAPVRMSRPVAAPAEPAAPAPSSGGGYQLSEHVQRYYRTARV